MRAIYLLKIVLLIGVAGAGTASAFEEKPVRAGILFHGEFADAGSGGTTAFVANTHDFTATQHNAIAAATVVSNFHAIGTLPRVGTARSAAAAPDVRLAALAPEEVLRTQNMLAPRAGNPASSRFAGHPRFADTAFSGDAMIDEQQRNLASLQLRASQPRMRSATDFWLMGLVGLMLIAYQLCRKHRFLRPQPFTL